MLKEPKQTQLCLPVRCIKRKRGNCKHRDAKSHTEDPGSLPFCRLCYRVTLRCVRPPSATSRAHGWGERPRLPERKDKMLYISPGCVTWKRVGPENVANRNNLKSPNPEQNKKRKIFLKNLKDEVGSTISGKSLSLFCCSFSRNSKSKFLSRVHYSVAFLNVKLWDLST